MKTELILLMTIMAAGVWASSPIEMIYSNRHHFIEMSNCSDGGQSLDSIECVPGRPNNSIYYKYRDSSLQFWQENERELIRDFVNRSANRARMYRRYDKFFSDSISIEILVSLIDYPFKSKKEDRPRSPVLPGYSNRNPSDSWNVEAVITLADKTYLPALEPFHEEILKRLERSPVPDHEKFPLIALCNPEDKEYYLELCDSLGICRPWVRARLGDTKAEQRIIDELKKLQAPGQISDNSAFEAIKNAVLTGTDSTMHYTLKLLKTDLHTTYRSFGYNGIIFPPEDSPYCFSLHRNIIYFLARYHPHTPLFQNRFRIMDVMDDEAMVFVEKQWPYFDDLAEWVKETYNFEISYENFDPYFFKYCQPELASERDRELFDAIKEKGITE